jgi:hypothetical protein
MNANELADDLWACFTKSDWEYVDEAVAMLRQQQAEIEALLKFIDERGETGQLIIWKAQEK